MKQPEQQDEFHGVGGSFVIDPASGLRRRVGEAQPDAEVAPDVPLPGAPAAPAAAQPVKTTRSK